MPRLLKPDDYFTPLSEYTKLNDIGTCVSGWAEDPYAMISLFEITGQEKTWHFPLVMPSEHADANLRFVGWQQDAFPDWIRRKVWGEPELPQHLILWAALACPSFRLSQALPSDLIPAGTRQDPVFVFRPGLNRSPLQAAGWDKMIPEARVMTKMRNTLLSTTTTTGALKVSGGSGSFYGNLLTGLPSKPLRFINPFTNPPPGYKVAHVIHDEVTFVKDDKAPKSLTPLKVEES